MSERRRPEPRPRDHTDAARDIARDLAEIAAQLSYLKGEAMNWLDDPNYAALRLRLENAHGAVEAATVEARWRVTLNEGRWAWGRAIRAEAPKDFGHCWRVRVWSRLRGSPR